MDTTHINHLAVLVAALSSFMVGGLWYSPMLLCKPWMKAAGVTAQDLERGNPAKIFGIAFVRFALRGNPGLILTK